MAYAILETGGKQYRAEKDAVLAVERLETEPGKAVKLERVLLWSDDKQVQIGTPYLAKAYVEAQVLEHRRNRKVIAYKAIRREGGAKTKIGHRQWTTILKIKNIKRG